MTYCVGLCLKEGIVMLSDTRTNAGVDNISTFCKMSVFEKTGDRMLAMMTAGNLAVSQAVQGLLNEGIENKATGEKETLFTVPNMFRAAQLVSEAVRQVFFIHGGVMQAQGIGFDVGIILGGQIGNGAMHMYQFYSAGNFIESSEDTPFLQLGEHKYGKPILDRSVGYDLPLYDAIKMVLLSMDSTLRSNLSVGLPLDLLVYKRGALCAGIRRRITDDEPYFRYVRESWSSALREAHQHITRPDWARD